MKKLFLLPLLLCANILIGQTILTQTETVPITCYGGTATIDVTTDATANFNYQVQNLVNGNWVNTFPVQTNTSPPNFQIFLFAATWRIILIDISSGLQVFVGGQFNVGQPGPIIEWSATSVLDVDCSGNSTGSIELFMAGGTPPYSYAWTTGQNTALITGLTAGTYSCTVTDAAMPAGCSYSNNPILVTVTQPATLSATTQQTNVSCFGGNNGSATVTPSGGTGPYTYLWSNGATTTTISTLVAGTYTCTVTDANGCLLENLTINISQPSATLTIQSITTNDVSCFGYTNGWITVNIAGGTAPYTYSWSPSGPSTTTNSTTDSYSGIIAGTNYSCNITDANGCSVNSGNITVSQPLETIFTTSTTSVICNGQSNGTATVNVSSGVGPYTYLWNNGQTTATAIGLTSGTYWCNITASNGCIQNSGNIVITQPTQIVINTSNIPVSCNGGTNGSATVSVSGGTAPYSYSWNIGGVFATATGLSTGTYWCTITDANGCQITSGNIFVSEPGPIVIITANTPVSCNGGNNATATVNVSGGTPGYTYFWNNGQTTATINTLPAGTYSCTVTDANFCTENSVNIIITQPTPIVITTSNTSVICNGGNTGTATVNVSGGGGGYLYLWSNGQTTATATGLITGNYSCAITDANNCTVNSGNIFISQPTPIVITTSNTSVICNGGNTGTATVSVSGGGPGYLYAWSNGQTTTTATGLISGTYSCNITDANGCTVNSGNIFVSQFSQIVITPSTTLVSCNGGSNGTATVSVLGGSTPYTYLWNNGQTTATAIGLSFGNYNCTITDANGCQITSGSILVNQPSQLVFTTANTLVSCYGGNNGTATVSVSGGTPPWNYFWSNGQTTATATGLSFGYYTCIITDLNGCTVNSGNILVSQPSTPIVITTSNTSVSCYSGIDGTATVTPTGGTAPYLYLWNDGQTTATAIGLITGNYNCIITDANGCQINSVGIFVGEPTQTVITEFNTPVDCNGGSNGSATVSVSGGGFPWICVWSNGATGFSITGLNFGSYSYTVTNANGCIGGIGSILINTPTQIIITPSTTSVICYGESNGTATASVSGGTGPYIYLWSNGQTTATAIGLTSGTYTCTITDANNCPITSASIFVGEPTQIVITPSTTLVSCFGYSDGTATVSVSGGGGGYTYLWNTGQITPTINTLPAGTYSCIVTATNGCTQNSGPIVVSEPAQLVITQSSTVVSCYGGLNGTATVSISGGTAPYTYFWNNGATGSTAIGLISGTYWCNITDFNGCQIISGNIFVNEPSELVFTASNTSVSCYGGNDGTATVSVSGGTGIYTYAWSPTPQITPSAIGLISGTYSCNITDGNGCQINSGPIVVGQPAALLISMSSTDVWCQGWNNGTATATPSGGTAPYTYSWDNGSTSPTITGLSANTSYTVIVTDAINCPTTTATITINGPTNIAQIATITPASCYGLSTGSIALSVSGGNIPYTYLWSNGQSTPTATLLLSGNYNCDITDALGCTVNSGNIFVPEPLQIVISTSNDSVNCFGETNGTATVSAIGGTGALTYSWSNGQTTPTATGLVIGSYTCTITDVNGCTETSQNIVVSQPAPLTILPTTTDVSCYGNNNGFVAAVIGGGTPAYIYSWSDGQTTANAVGLIAGTYILTVYDYNNCPATASVLVQQPTQITTSITTTNVDCYGDATGVATATAVSGSSGAPYTYLWDNGNNSPINMNLSAGTYGLTITDGIGCSNTFSTTITQSTLITSIIASTNISVTGANDGIIAVTGISGGCGGYTYSWSCITNGFTGSGLYLNNLSAGLYTLVVTDACGCEQSFDVLINEPNCNVIITDTYIAPVCYGDLGSLTWTNSGGLPPYDNYLYNPSTGVVFVNHVLYNSPSAPLLLPVGVFAYNLIVTDANGCEQLFDVTVTTPDSIIVNTITSDALCFGSNEGTASAIVTGGVLPYTINWGIYNPAALFAGTYNVQVMDGDGCFSEITPYTIDQPADLLIDSVVTSLVSCVPGTDGTATVFGSGGTLPYTYLWSDGQITQTATNLIPGTYAVTITDSNGCSQATVLPIIISNSPSLTISVATTAISCTGGSNGTLSATVVTGTNPVTYIWSNSFTGTAISSNDSVTNLSSGAYTVVATDANGCIDTWSGGLVNPTPIFSFLTTTSITSNGANNGTISTFLPTGGTGPYSYSWVGPSVFTSTTQDLTGLAAGTYTVTITDAVGCTLVLSSVINEPACNVTLTSTITQPPCYLDSGTVTWTNSGGGTPYTNSIIDLSTIPSTLLFTGSGNTGTFSLVGGNYVLQTTDAFGCSDLVNISITEPNALIANVTTDSVSCFNGTNGTVSITPTGGTSPYTINYGSIIPTALSAGTYSFTLTDANGCLSIPPLNVFNIFEPAQIILTISGTSTSCSGDSTGSATVTATGGTYPYSYFWSPTGLTTATINNIAAITHYVTITDAHGCPSAPAPILITGPTPLTVSIAPINASCYGLPDGSATATALGGTAPYLYFWSTGATGPTVTGLVAGTYSCTVRDGQGCMTTVSTTINEPDEIVANLTLTNISCNGLSDGSALINPITPIGGAGGNGYTILWYSGSNGLSVSNLGVGNYSVIITDNTTYCTTQNSPILFNITQPNALVLSTNVLNNTGCTGYSTGSATVTATGGTLPYTYLWSNGQITQTATGLAAGSYTVIVTDSNSCSDTSLTIIITEPTPIVANVTVNTTLCIGSSDGSATANPTGGTAPYTYSWTGGITVSTSATYSGLNSATTYFLTITDANGCTLSGVPVNIPAPVAITISFTTLSNFNGYDVSCNGGNNGIVQANALGGTAPYLYSEDGVNYAINSIFSSVSAGGYSVFVMDANGCTLTDNTIISEPTAINPNITITNMLTCSGVNDGALLSSPIGGVGGYTYLWSPGGGIADNISALSAGSYSVAVTDINGCTVDSTITLTPSYILSAISNITPVSCTGWANGIASITVTGGTLPYTYLWSNGTTTDVNNGLLFGSYWCMITDANGCMITDTVHITQSANSLTITNATITDVSCNGGNDGEIKLTVTGGAFPYDYLWDDPNSQTTATANTLYADTFIVSVTDDAGCTIYDTLIVNEPTPVMINLNPIDISCFGEEDGTISALISGGTPPYTYLWSNGQTSPVINNLMSGTYSITVIDASGCILIDSATINQPPPLVCIVIETNPLCHNDANGTLDLLISGGTQPYAANYISVSYPTSSNSIIISGLSAGSDSLFITDANGCFDNTLVTLTNPLELEINNLTKANPTCYDYADGVASITVIGGTTPYTYLWNPGGQTTTTAVGLMSGSYNYTITDVNGCTDTTSFTLNNPDEIQVIATIEDVLCFGTSEGSISVNVSNTIGDYQIFWEGVDNDSIFIDNLTSGLYNVTIIDDNNCTKTDSILVNQNEEIVINYTVYDALCKKVEDGIIEINNIYGGTSPYNIYKNGELHTEGTYSSATIENLVASDNNIPYIITVIDNNNCETSTEIMIDYIGGYNCIDEPIIISPNYDGTNDFWQPVVDLDEDMEVSILNRWGELEYDYTGNSILFIWDGLGTNGQKLPSTDYYYIIKFKNPSYPARTGALTLIR